jgi:hypothetical protein
MKEFIRIVFGYWLEVLIAIILLYSTEDIRLFLLFFFIFSIILFTKHIDYLRKLIRVFQVANEIKLITIIRKLKITEDEISIVTEDEKKKMGSKKWEEIEKDFLDLSQRN